MKKLIFILLFIPSLLNAAIYYVSNSGNDGAAGTSIATAWRTVAKVNSGSFPAGDQVLFRKGGIWYEKLIPPSSGSSGNPVIFGAYDSGSDPIITARGALPNWTNSGSWTDRGNNRWSISYGGNYRHRIWINGTETQEAQYSSTVSSTLRLYSGSSVIWVYATGNPATTYTSMEISGVLSSCLDVSSKNYITFQGIDFRGGGGGGWVCVTISGSNYITFDVCKIGKDAGCYGLRATDSDYGEVKNCTFDTGDRFNDVFQAENSEDGIAIMDGCDGWLVHDNYFQDWGHTTIALLKNNAGSSVTNNKIYRNYVTSPNSDYGRGIGIGGLPGGSLTGNEAYDNTIYNTPTRSQINFPYIKFYNNLINTVRGDNGLYNHNDPGQGIGIQEYEGQRAIYMKFYNNTIVNCVKPGIEFIGWQATEIELNEIINNIIANCGSHDSNIQFDGDNYSQVNQNTYRNNLFYSSATSNVIRYRGTIMTVAAFNAQNGSNGDVMANNISGNPLFVSSTNFHLLTGSPAIDAGYSPTLSAYDKDGIAWGTPSTIGAYENTGAATTPTVATSSISNIGYTTAISGGFISSDGGASVTARGVCWNTSSNPTTSNPKTNNGTGTGLFFSDITLLQMGTLYYVRAYATNSEGTAYGANQQFTTLAEEEPPPSGEGKIVVFEGKIVTSGGKIVIK